MTETQPAADQVAAKHQLLTAEEVAAAINDALLEAQNQVDLLRGPLFNDRELGLLLAATVIEEYRLRRAATAKWADGQGGVERLRREIRYLRSYGNKDCTALADEAMARDEMERE
jgi:hypothetical protein